MRDDVAEKVIRPNLGRWSECMSPVKPSTSEPVNSLDSTTFIEFLGVPVF